MKVVIKQILLIITLVISSALYCNAEEGGEDIMYRGVPEYKIGEYLNNSDFDYLKGYQAPVTIWDLIQYWIYKNILAPLGSKTPASFWGFLQILLVVFTFVVVTFYLVKTGKVSLFSKGGPSAKIPVSILSEDIHGINFDQLLQDALNNQNYRMAVRYQYLKSLKNLADNNLIQWKAEKTNRDYNRELKSTAFAPLFKEVTLLFDYCCYGNSILSESAYLSVSSSFERLNNALTTAK